uniref:Integrin-linked kinase-associated serine/threonine phosphatase 2C n=4 Tax=Schistocephalus solidus TaxID=70667 RepID=A0A0V0J1A7_SCHSO
MARIEKDIKRIIVDAYKTTDEEFLKEATRQRPHWKDGSTASLVLLVNNVLYISNIGDSGVVLGRIRDAEKESVGKDATPTDEDATGGERIVSAKPSSLYAVPLTRDHTPLEYEERQRILKFGATVLNGRINNAIEVSRSFGDYQFKKQGVICIPDVNKYDLTSNDKFFLIACDGLWKCFPPEEAVGLTNRLLAANNVNLDKPGDDLVALQQSLDAVCKQLVTEAVLRLSGDNVTCILVLLLDPETPYGSSSNPSSSP